MATSEYTPISCALHSEYELAIMHKKRLRLRWQDGDQMHNLDITPVDLTTRDNAEFLLGKNESGQPVEIRLDKILGIND